MLKKKIKLIDIMEVQAEEPKKKKKEVPKKEFIKTVEDMELPLTDEVKLVFSVAQVSEDSPCHVDIRTWLASEKYTGPTKKGVNFNIEYLDEVIGILQAISEDCSKRGV